MTWTTDETAQLTEAWEAGTSASLIGKAMGKSKNAVVGKAHRMRLESRPSPIRRGMTHMTVRRKLNLPRAKAGQRKGAVPTAPPESEAPVPLGRETCQFIKGEKGTDFTLYANAPRCGETALLGSPYCPAHHRRTHHKTQPREAA